MATMNISIPEDLRAEVEAQIRARGYGTSSEYMRDLIRRDIERQKLRDLLLDGRQSLPGQPVSGDRLDRLRRRARSVAGAKSRSE